MADPHHVEPLDRFDISTVRAYRVGLVLCALATGALAASLLWLPALVTFARFSVLLAAALVVLNLHLYDRTLRYIISASGWISALLIVLSSVIAPFGELPSSLASDAGLGFAFVVFSAVALKERYCFRLPLVVAVPALLALSLVPLLAGLMLPTAALLGLAAAVLSLLAGAKLRMPLHYDIGDKRHYQV